MRVSVDYFSGINQILISVFQFSKPRSISVLSGRILGGIDNLPKIKSLSKNYEKIESLSFLTY